MASIDDRGYLAVSFTHSVLRERRVVRPLSRLWILGIFSPSSPPSLPPTRVATATTAAHTLPSSSTPHSTSPLLFFHFLPRSLPHCLSVHPRVCVYLLLPPQSNFPLAQSASQPTSQTPTNFALSLLSTTDSSSSSSSAWDGDGDGSYMLLAGRSLLPPILPFDHSLVRSRPSIWTGCDTPVDLRFEKCLLHSNRKGQFDSTAAGKKGHEQFRTRNVPRGGKVVVGPTKKARHFPTIGFGSRSPSVALVVGADAGRQLMCFRRRWMRRHELARARERRRQQQRRERAHALAGEGKFFFSEAGCVS